MENIGRAFSFMFEDKDWVQKILIGGAFVLLSFILIGIPFVLGYLLVLIKNASEGRPLPLPTWDDMGTKFTNGLMFLIVIIVWAIPLALVHFILWLIPCIGWLGSILLSIATAMLYPYIAVRFARSNNFADAFDFAGIIAFFTQNFTNLLIVAIMSIVFSIIAGFGVLAFLIGYLFTSFWAALGITYLYGEVVRVGERVQTTTPQ